MSARPPTTIAFETWPRLSLNVVPDCTIEFADDAGPDKRSYRVSFEKIRARAAGIQAAVGCPHGSGTALRGLSFIRPDARRVRGAAIPTHRPYQETVDGRNPDGSAALRHSQPQLQAAS